MTVGLGIVAHTARLAQAEALATAVDAMYVSVDDGTLGAGGNHRKVWSRLAEQGGDWTVVLEDDAIPVDDFRTHLDAALAAAPAPIVSLYLGTGNPKHWQHTILHAVRNADLDDAAWITCPNLLHAVGVAVRTDLVPAMLTHITHAARASVDRNMLPLPIDDAITAWAQADGHLIAYTHPSLVDHDDGPTLVNHPDGGRRDEPRKAWRHGTPTEWRRTVELAY